MTFGSKQHRLTIGEDVNIVLHEPEIPHNTGAIGRTCLMTQTQLHLIHPLGFSLDEQSVKRAGLDYWHKVNVHEYESFKDFLERNPNTRLFLAESGSGQLYTDVEYSMGDYIIFGSETKGLPISLLTKYPDRIIKIPMIGEERSINLSVSVGVILFEALRQNGFVGLK